uniref:Uncharacterized protein n=1 Tax=Cannabis sativa TaxID=3483 RepID=A0A803QSH3_CANSA
LVWFGCRGGLRSRIRKTGFVSKSLSRCRSKSGVLIGVTGSGPVQGPSPHLGASRDPTL